MLSAFGRDHCHFGRSYILHLTEYQFLHTPSCYHFTQHSATILLRDPNIMSAVLVTVRAANDPGNS